MSRPSSWLRGERSVLQLTLSCQSLRNTLSRTSLVAAASHRGFHTDGSCLEGVVAGLGRDYLDCPKSEAPGTRQAKRDRIMGKMAKFPFAIPARGALPRLTRTSAG